MPDKSASTSARGRELNPDPLTGEAGAHPLGTGVGAATGGAAGAVIGSAGGPVDAVLGAVAGGLAGKGVAEMVDPTVEDTYWCEHHGTQPYAITSRPYADFAAAYRAGYAGYREGRTFEEREADLRIEYERGGGLDPGLMAGGGLHPTYPLRWEEVRDAARAAYERVAHGKARHPEPKAEPARGAGE